MTEYEPAFTALETTAPEEPIQSAPRHERRWLGLVAKGALIGGIAVAGAAYLHHRVESTKLGCDAKLVVNDSAATMIHLPDGSMMFGGVRESGIGLTITMGDFSQTLPTEEVARHPTISFEATEDTAVRFQVTEALVTTSCAPVQASK